MSTTACVPVSILREKIYRNDDAVRLLLHLMLIIAEDEAADPGDEARRAGVVTRPLTDIATQLRWSRSKIVRVMDALKAADAVRTRGVTGGTEITCLYYAPSHDFTLKKPKAAPKVPKPLRTSIEDRTARFTAACKAVCDADPARLPEPLRKEFHAYWTEPNEHGRMRFEAQPFFDHCRRMDTWRRRAEAMPNRQQSQHVAKPTTQWNPRA